MATIIELQFFIIVASYGAQLREGANSLRKKQNKV